MPSIPRNNTAIPNCTITFNLEFISKRVLSADTIGIVELIFFRKPGALLSRVWTSPTAMTWASLALRSVGGIVVLPILLRELPPEEVSIWYLLITITSINGLLDLGFNPSFSRVVAYAKSGLKVQDLAKGRPIADGVGATVDSEALQEIYATMRYLYFRLAFGATIILAIWGTISLVRPVQHLSAPSLGWVVWTITLGFAPLAFIGNLYLSFLQGSGHVAEVRRWDALLTLCGILSNFCALIAGTGLLGVVISSQAWLAIGVLRSWWLFRRLCPEAVDKRGVELEKIKIVMRGIWPSCWRFGLGSMLYSGGLQLSGVFYAQIGKPESVAAYLLSSQVLNILRNTAQAPFYSKIPLLSQLWAGGKKEQFVALAKRGMFLSYWSLIAGFLGAGLIGTFGLSFLQTKTQFAGPLLWALMGFGMFVERYGGMHQNLISVTNRVVSHWAGGGFLILFMLTVALGVKVLGVYAFPTGIIIGHLLFFSWFSGKVSYLEHNLSFWQFEKSVFIPAFIGMLAAAIAYVLVLTSLHHYF